MNRENVKQRRHKKKKKTRDSIGHGGNYKSLNVVKAASSGQGVMEDDDAEFDHELECCFKDFQLCPIGQGAPGGP